MFWKTNDLSIRAKLVFWGTLASLVVTVCASVAISVATHAQLHGLVKTTMHRILDDLKGGYVEFGGLTEAFRQCIDEDAEEHNSAILRVSVLSPDGRVLHATPALRQPEHTCRRKETRLMDGNIIRVERDIDEIISFEIFLAFLLAGIGILSVVGVACFTAFIGGRILKLNLMVDTRDKALEELRTLTDDIAHDLRTPLTRLNMAAESALLNTVPQDLPERVAQETGAMLEMINTMLDISQTGFRIDRTPREELDLTAVISDFVELYRALADEQGLTLGLQVPTAPTPYSAHKAKIQQALGNLLDNAVKFTPRGGRIDVRLTETESELRLSVSDTGLGIAAADLPHIFKRFYRADASRSLPGNGLGLALVQAIATSYGGAVDCTSTLGRGTTLTLRLPRR